MELPFRPLLGVLFGLLGIFVWIGGMVALSYIIDRKTGEES